MEGLSKGLRVWPATIHLPGRRWETAALTRRHRSSALILRQWGDSCGCDHGRYRRAPDSRTRARSSSARAGIVARKFHILRYFLLRTGSYRVRSRGVHPRACSGHQISQMYMSRGFRHYYIVAGVLGLCMGLLAWSSRRAAAPSRQRRPNARCERGCGGAR